MPTIIEPTVGRVVWFYNNTENGPLAAIIAEVHSDRMVSLMVINRVGETSGHTSISLIQEGDTYPDRGSYCEWMPYQKGQVPKTEALEAQKVQV